MANNEQGFVLKGGVSTTDWRFPWGAIGKAAASLGALAGLGFLLREDDELDEPTDWPFSPNQSSSVNVLPRLPLNRWQPSPQSPRFLDTLPDITHSPANITVPQRQRAQVSTSWGQPKPKPASYMAQNTVQHLVQPDLSLPPQNSQAGFSPSRQDKWQKLQTAHAQINSIYQPPPSNIMGGPLRPTYAETTYNWSPSNVSSRLNAAIAPYIQWRDELRRRVKAQGQIIFKPFLIKPLTSSTQLPEQFKSVTTQSDFPKREYIRKGHTHFEYLAAHYMLGSGKSVNIDINDLEAQHWDVTKSPVFKNLLKYAKSQGKPVFVKIPNVEINPLFSINDFSGIGRYGLDFYGYLTVRQGIWHFNGLATGAKAKEYGDVYNFEPSKNRSAFGEFATAIGRNYLVKILK